jgi:trehalose 6-phosphate phosphatase
VAGSDRADRSLPAAAARALLAPLVARPAGSAIITDFDGTLSPIVSRPELARPVDGSAELLARLAARFAVVAVVSGRPVSFLMQHLVSEDAVPGPPPTGTPRFFGLYGLERSGPDGSVTVDGAVVPWLPVVDEVLGRLAGAAPDGVLVESKGLAVTVHWRTVPEAEPWALAAVADEVARTGLVAHPGRRSVELRLPLPVDKGSVTATLAGECSAAVFLGDDLGDLPAFAALDELRASRGVATVKVAVADHESAPEVLAAADLVLAGPDEALDVLAWLASSVP